MSSIKNLPLWLTTKQACGLINVSLAKFERMKAAGLLPAHVAMGRVHRWSREELEKWLEAGAPDRQTWEVIKAAKK